MGNYIQYLVITYNGIQFLARHLRLCPSFHLLLSWTLRVSTGESSGSSQVFSEHVSSCEHGCGLPDPPGWSSSLVPTSSPKTLTVRFSCLSLLAQTVLPGHSGLQFIYSPYMLSTNTTQRKPLQPWKSPREGGTKANPWAYYSGNRHVKTHSTVLCK